MSKCWIIDKKFESVGEIKEFCCLSGQLFLNLYNESGDAYAKRKERFANCTNKKVSL